MRLAILLLFGVLLPGTYALAQDDPFVGRFGGEIDGLQHELLLFSDSPGLYDGDLKADGKRLPVFGRRHGELLLGKIGSGEEGFEFRASAIGSALLIERRSKPPLRFFRKKD